MTLNEKVHHGDNGDVLPGRVVQGDAQDEGFRQFFIGARPMLAGSEYLNSRTGMRDSW